MTTYRTGNHWGVTIVRESDSDPNPQCPGEYHGADGGACGVCGWDSHDPNRKQDEQVAVVTNGDTALAARIAWLLTHTCPTCMGPSRETVDMVCPTCGTDYDPEARVIERTDMAYCADCDLKMMRDTQHPHPLIPVQVTVTEVRA